MLGRGLSVRSRAYGCNLKRRISLSSQSTAEETVPAAAYVRMSTDNQNYSTENQLNAIELYAEQRGFNIVKVFEDSGRSGLRVDGRDGLQRLMKEVQSGSAEFYAVLVYDVSRWGRFQDADEGAYHEYVCSRAGIRIHYCGEQFENDGSIGSILLKSVKRVMAGEYSRELSVKVFAGQCRHIEDGFRQGGPAGYGLRRQMIDEHRTPKGELKRGDRKSLQTDRVILIPGPQAEIDTVERIYRRFVDDGRSERDIANELNDEGLFSDLDRPWTRSTIHQVLTNEKYIGNNVFNRISFKLKHHRVVNPPETWVRAEGAFAPIVDAALFARARSIINQRTIQYSDKELLGILQGVLQSEGYLSGLIIDEYDNTPSSSIYRARFGSLLRAYHLIGYAPERDYRYIEVNRDLRNSFPAVRDGVLAGIRSTGATAEIDPLSDLILINDEFHISLALVRCTETANGRLRWTVKLDTGLIPDISIAVRMDRANQEPQDYYVLPSLDLTIGKLRLAEDNAFALDAYRFTSLDAFYSLCRRTPFWEAA